MKTSARSLRIAVGTVLLGLGGCTPSTGTTTDGAKKTPPVKTEAKESHTVNEGPVESPPKVPDPTPKTPDDGGCQPPDCHINPGPNDDPKHEPDPEVQPETPPPPPPIKVNPGPDAQPEPEPKRVNTGPVPSREH